MKLQQTALVVALAMVLGACSTTPKEDASTEGNGANQAGAISTGADSSNTSGEGLNGGMDAEGMPAQRLVYFEYDASTLRSDAVPVVEEHARYLQAHPERNLRLEGHADERGSREYNLALGERRALAVQQYLSILNVPASRVRTHSYGEEMPLVSGHDESSWQQNRRVEFVYE